jgi:hypothetical protein
MVKRKDKSTEIAKEVLESFYELIEDYDGWVKKNKASNANRKKAQMIKKQFDEDSAKTEMKFYLDKLSDKNKVDFPVLLDLLIETKAKYRRNRNYRRAKSELMGRTKEYTPGRQWAIRRNRIKTQLDHISTEIPKLYQDAQSKFEGYKQKPGYNPQIYYAIRRFGPDTSIENVPLGPKDERVLEALDAFQKVFNESPLFQGEPRRRPRGHQSEKWIKLTLQDLKKIHVPYFIGRELLRLIGVKPSLDIRKPQTNPQ